MSRNTKNILRVVFYIFLGVLLILKMNKDKNEILISKDIVHGTYAEENNRFVTLSFDVNNMEYFYYGLNENYSGEFIYLGNGIYKINSGKFENYFVKTININTVEVYNDNEKRIFKRTTYIPTIINQKIKTTRFFSCLFRFNFYPHK